MCGVEVELLLELPPTALLDDSSPKKSGKSVPCSGMTPRVLSIKWWSAAAPEVLSSSRVDSSLSGENMYGCEEAAAAAAEATQSGVVSCA